MNSTHNAEKFPLRPNVKYHTDFTNLHGTKLRSVALPKDLINPKKKFGLKNERMDRLYFAPLING
jgi:hypothetical protein